MINAASGHSRVGQRGGGEIFMFVCVCACVGDYAAAPFITLQIGDPCVDPFCLDLIKMLLEHSSS